MEKEVKITKLQHQPTLDVDLPDIDENTMKCLSVIMKRLRILEKNLFITDDNLYQIS